MQTLYLVAGLTSFLVIINITPDILSAYLFVGDILLTLLILSPIVYTSFRRFQLSVVFLYLR